MQYTAATNQFVNKTLSELYDVSNCTSWLAQGQVDTRGHSAKLHARLDRILLVDKVSIQVEIVNETLSIDLRKMNIEEAWDVQATAAAIVAAGHRRVTLQFPDELLRDAALVAALLQSELAAAGSTAQVRSGLWCCGSTASYSYYAQHNTCEHAHTHAPLLHVAGICSCGHYLQPTERGRGSSSTRQCRHRGASILAARHATPPPLYVLPAPAQHRVHPSWC